MNALGCHVFSGGFSLGVERHFNILAHLERTKYGVSSWRRHRPGVAVYVSKTASWTVAPYAGKVDFVYGNPPCSAWSPSSVGYARKGESPWLDWARDVVRVGWEVGARVIAVESVRGAALHGAQFYRGLRDRHGLSASWVMVNARDHGLAQHRPRLFVLFTLGEVFVPEWEAEPMPTVLDQINGVELGEAPISPRSIYHPGVGVRPEEFLKCIPALKPGMRLRDAAPEELALYSKDVSEKIGAVKFGGHMLTRVSVDKPCPVVYGLARYVHPTEDRLLTLRELMRLQGYPDDFYFDGDQATALRMLGKTVCPPVGEWLAGEVAAYLRGERDVLRQREALFDCCSDPPSRGLPPEDPETAESAPTTHFGGWDEVSGVSLPAITSGASKERRTRTVTRRSGTRLPEVEVDPSWSELPGPTALARLLISKNGASDEEILSATSAVFGARTGGPHLFTRADLTKLRARLERNANTTVVS